MRKRRTITKCRQIMAFLMALLVTLTCAPQTALAYIGAVRDNSGSADETLKTGTFTYNGDTYMYIENEYLHFDICVASKKGERVGKYCHTIPTASLPRKNGNKQYTNLDSFGVQTISHTISVKRQHAGNWSDMSNIKVSSYSTAFVDDYEKEYTGSGNLGDKCIFLEGTIDNRPIREYFTLVRVDGGEFDNEYFHKDHILADNGETNNWGVRARGTCGRSSKINYSGEDGELIMPETSDFYRMTLDYQKFPIMGHPGVDVAAPVISAQTIRGEYVTWKGYPTKKINIDAGIDFTSAHTILEVYSDSYSFAAPFVAASSKYSGDVDGHDSFTYPEKVRYKDFALHALGNYEQNHMTYGDHHAHDDSRVSSYALWGYRKLYTYDQINGTPEIQNQVNDNYVKVEGKDYLYITKKGGVTSVNVASNYASIPNNALAYYYGDYTTDKNGYYYFKENVQLSPTITMSWDKNDTSIKVYLKSDGTFVFPADKVTLESPAFTFYEPKADADPGSPTAPGLAFKGYDVWDSQNQYTQKGLVLDMNPDKNNAILSFALPSNEVSAKRVAINKSGEVVFSGRLALDLFLAEMDMQRLSYSKNKQGKFMVNGLEAKGALKAPEGELDWKIFNFGGTNITGDISTFKDNEHYSFELTISAKDLFETNAELDLRRLNNGRLVPNNLSFDLAVKKDGIGLDITPSTPVVTLTGGGGGVYNIADQMNGNYLSIPPVIVKLTGTGQVLKVMEGKLDLYVGPSKLSLESKDIGFKIPGRERINIIKGLSAGYNLNDAVITYNGNKYQGYRFGGNISADLSLIPEKSANTKIKKLFVDTVTASLALGANVTVAENHQIQQAYASMGLSGSGGCSFQIPIIKYEVVSGKLEMKIEGVGEYPRNGNPLKNMEAKGGIVATGQLGKALYGQVVYLIPDTITVDGGFGQADNYDWDQLESQGEAILASHGGMAVEGQPVLVDMEDGSQMLAVFATNTYPITASVKDASETGDDEIVSETASVSADSVSGNAADTDASDDADEAIDVENDASYSKEISIDKNQVEDGECVILMAIPKDQADMTALMESIGATSLVGWTKVTPSRMVVTKPGSESETVSEITNNEDMTVWDGAYEYSDDGTNTVESEAVYLSIPKETIPANGIFSIFAEKDFTLKAMATAPVTSVSGNCVGSTAQVTVENPVDGVIYSLNTYYGTKDEKGNIGQEFMVDSRMVNSSSNESYTSSILLESTGSAAPTGEYYVTTILSDPEGLPIASCQLGTINYTNNTVPVQPASVSLEKIGNETLRATWSKVESSNPKVDGYKLTVYQKDGEDLVDTGRGYDLTVADLENNDISVSENTIPGLSYDPDNKTYSIDMALTVGGVDMNNEGQEVHDENLAGLPADKEYAIGVSAYTNKEVFAFASGEDLSAEGDGDTSSDKISVPSSGKERISGTSSIAQYKETSFSIYVDGNQLSQDPDTKTYTYTGNVNGASRLVLDGFNAGGADVSGEVAVTVSYKDENGEEKTLDEEGGYYNLPVFTGSLPLDIKVVYTHDGVGDETTAHVNIDRDDAPPVITLDQTVFYADENGNYSVTGITEPDSQINAIFEYGSGKSSETKQFTVSANGIFAIEGQLQLSASAESGVSAESVSNNTVMDYQSVMITMKATDACGNDSAEINTIVSKQVKKPAATITKRPVLSTASLTYNGSEQNYVSAEGEADGGTIMYALTKADVAPESNSDYSSNATVVNAGTYFVWAKAVADIRHADSAPLKLGKITVAKKTEAPNTPKNLNVSNNVLKLTNNILSENYPGWEWAAEDLNKEISESGSIRATAIYTAEDKDNYKNVSVVISVFRAEHTHEADEAVKENNVAPGCLTNGSYDMVTYCIHCHAELSRENKKVPPAGHDYSVSYTWSQDGKSCVGKAVCKRAGCNASTQGHSVTEEATVTTGSKTGATKDEVVAVYTASFKNGIFKTQTKEISYKKSGTQVTDTKTGSKVVVTSKAGEDPAVAYKGPVKAKAKNVTVPSAVTINGISYKVTSIADNAFKGNKAVKKLKLPDTITTIGKNAFMGTSLKTVTIPASVKKIGANAFKNTKLKTVTIKSKKITSIGKNAFGKKGGKYKVILPKSLKKKERKKYETMLKRAGVPKKNIKYK